MFFQVFKKELAGHLDDEYIVLNRNRLNRLKPCLEVLPLYDILDDRQTIGPNEFGILLHVRRSSFYIELYKIQTGFSQDVQKKILSG